MSFQSIYDTTTGAINILRGQMDAACRQGLTTLATPLFDENPTVSSVYWTQSFDPAGAGFSLGTIKYTVVKVINGVVSPHEVHMAAVGPTPLVMFATFLRSIAYHLFCAYGANATVTVTASGVTVTKN